MVFGVKQDVCQSEMFDGVSDWSGFLQTVEGNLTLTFTSTCSHWALWGHRAPLRWVRGQRNETTCQQGFSLMRYFDKVNYIQQAHNGGKAHGGKGHSHRSIQLSRITSGLVCCTDMKNKVLQRQHDLNIHKMHSSKYFCRRNVFI